MFLKFHFNFLDALVPEITPSKIGPVFIGSATLSNYGYYMTSTT